jgi:hypothetical protein
MSDSGFRSPTTPLQTPRQTPSNSVDSMNIDVMMTPPPSRRSIQVPPAPRKAVRFNTTIRRIIDADKSLEQKIRLTLNLDIPDDLKKEILKYLKSESGLAKLKLIFSPDNSGQRTPSPHDQSASSSIGLVRGGRKAAKNKKKSLKKRKATKKQKLTRGGKKR